MANKHMKKMLNIPDYYRNTKLKLPFTPVRMAIINKSTIANAGGGVEKREPSCTAGGNVNWYNHYGKQYGSTSEN